MNICRFDTSLIVDKASLERYLIKLGQLSPTKHKNLYAISNEI
jgi:hypothetical protein